MQQVQLYNVVYYPRPSAKGQVLDYNKPSALAQWLKRQYKRTTHKMGQIKVEKQK